MNEQKNKPTNEQKQEIENNLMVFCFKCAARINNKYIKKERTYGKLGASIQEISKSMNSLKAINNDVEIYDTEKQDYKIIKHYECLNQYTDEEDETKTVQTCKEYITAKYWLNKVSNLTLKETLAKFDGDGLKEMFFTYKIS